MNDTSKFRVIFNRLEDHTYEKYLNIVDSWEIVNCYGGNNRTTARMILGHLNKWDLQYTGFLYYEPNEANILELVACACAHKTKRVLHIDYIASKLTGKGYGKNTFYRICKYAYRDGLSIELVSLEASKGFYDKLGLTRSSIPGEYKFSKSNAINFVDKVEKFGIYSIKGV